MTLVEFAHSFFRNKQQCMSVCIVALLAFRILWDGKLASLCKSQRKVVTSSPTHPEVSKNSVSLKFCQNGVYRNRNSERNTNFVITYASICKSFKTNK
jgi:hypothetical protein